MPLALGKPCIYHQGPNFTTLPSLLAFDILTMSTQLRFTQAALVVCFAVAVWGTLGLITTAGAGKLISDLRYSKTPLLPNTSVPVKTKYTGIGPIDSQLVVLGVFFWSVLDHNHPEYALHLNDFAFQFAVQYGLCVIEGSRPGNAGKLIS